jgi:hypothetical protein
MQATADADYFIRTSGRAFTATEQAAIHDVTLKAYRWQYIITGALEPRFAEVMKELVPAPQMQRIEAALGPIATHATN